jgi:hypothetical protein
VKNSGNHARHCLQARIVAAAYKKAGDDDEYLRWKQTGEIECAH